MKVRDARNLLIELYKMTKDQVVLIVTGQKKIKIL